MKATESKQTTLFEEPGRMSRLKQQMRSRAEQDFGDDGRSLYGSQRFLYVVPKDAEIDDFPELYEIWQGWDL